MLKTLKNTTFAARRAFAAAISPSNASYSAAGEDLLAWSRLSALGVDPSAIRYLDIGAAHPSLLSNTCLFYVRGGSGVLVEPDPDQAMKLRSARPRDVVIEAGAAFDDRRQLKLSRMTSPLFNSFSPSRAADVAEASKSWGTMPQQVLDSIDVDLIPANDLLIEHFSSQPLHLLSIDAEGEDFAILKSIDIQRFAPSLICIELQATIDDHLQILGDPYRLVFHSPDNAMFARIR